VSKRVWIATVASGAALAACGSDDPPQTPTACLSPASAYLTALKSAPGDVRLADGSAIGECLVPEQGSGPLQTVGQSLVGAATSLNADARREPGGDAALRLGYLAGVVEAATVDTGGIHEDLELRLESASRFTPGGAAFPARFERRFATGYAAGREAG
jgi:hypothetical protein